MASRLGLGTAQFGLDYGIANDAGRVPEAEVTAILDEARRADIRVLDTAPAYGTAQAVLGRLLRPQDRFRVVTKTVAIRTPGIGDEELATVRKGFEESLAQLGVDHVAGLLVHQADDLAKPGGERLAELLMELRAQGKVDKVGISVYDRAQLEQLLERRYAFDLVQLPLNVFDQRLVRDGTLASLAGAGVELHARSVFLQGLLLMDEMRLPAFAAPWRERIRDFRRALDEAGVTALAAALSFVLGQAEVSVALVGVLSADHLQECLAAEKKPVSLDWGRFAIDDPALVDPRRWPRSE